jgi:hypothetical protein
VLLILTALLYILIIQNICKKDASPRKLTEPELLTKLARMGPHNEYDIFHLAAGEWHISQHHIDEDFKNYLLQDLIPYYVNAYLRKIANEKGDVFRPPFSLGGGSLPWLK